MSVFNGKEAYEYGLACSTLEFCNRVTDAAMRRPINEIIIHCTGTSPNPLLNVNVIRKYHIEHNHWMDIGYHFLITVGGTIQWGRPMSEVGAHCLGHNAESIGICYVGGMYSKEFADTRTMLQREALRWLVATLCEYIPNISKVHGHRFYNPAKKCPCFNVEREFSFNSRGMLNIIA